MAAFLKPFSSSNNVPGRTSLHLAAKYGRTAEAILLIRGGADPTVPDAKGKSAFDLASTYAKYNTFEVMQQLWAKKSRRRRKHGALSPRSKVLSSRHTSFSHPAVFVTPKDEGSEALQSEAGGKVGVQVNRKIILDIDNFEDV